METESVAPELNEESLKFLFAPARAAFANVLDGEHVGGGAAPLAAPLRNG